MSPTDSAKKKGPQAACTRDLILESALELFADRGYEGVSVQDIAAAVGIRAASLYAHFPGKEAIFRAVFALALGKWEETAAGCMREASGPGSPETRIARVLLAFVSAMADSTVYRFWTRVYVFPPRFLRDSDFAACAALDRKFVDGLRSVIADGLGLKPAAAASLSSALMNYAAGLLVNSAYAAPSMREIRAAASLMIRGALGMTEGRKG